MIEKVFFNEKNIELFMPDGIEFIHDILQNIGYTKFNTLEARQEGLSILQNLFKLKLIEIFHWGKHHEIIKQLDLNTKQTIKFIDVTWFEGADFEDFVDMPMFKYKDWYLNALKNEGLTHTTNWKSFVEEKIGNLEKWIEENKPK